MLKLLLVPLWVLAAPPTDPEVLIGADRRTCSFSQGRWELTGEHTVGKVLEELSKRTCQRYLVRTSVRDAKVRLPAGLSAELTSRELTERLGAALRAEGLVQEVETVSRIVRAEEASPTPALRPLVEEEPDAIVCEERKCKVKRGVLERLMNGAGGTQARIVPSFVDGKVRGMKLFAIRARSTFARLGLQNGDVAVKLNGFELATPEKMLELYSKLRTVETLTLELERYGKGMSIEYTLVD